MGNDLSSTTARTPIPLDDAACWQLYNGVNERAEPISMFSAKQTFSVECRRSVQFLKTIRHPNIVKFLTGFKTFVEQDSFIADCVHPLANKLNSNDTDSSAKLCLGLHQLSQALEFLHEKASISHNNVCLPSLYISLNGTWKLGNFECACRYDNLTKKYLSTLKLIRAEDSITPEEDEQNPTDLSKEGIYAIDVYGFGALIRQLMTIVNVDDPLKNLLDGLNVSLTDEDPQSRPTWSSLLQTELFQIDYIRASELLDRLPTVEPSDLADVVESLASHLDNLDTEYFNELLIRRLFVPFMFLCPSTRAKIIPRILIPKETDANAQSWISTEAYRTYVIPLIVDLFAYHVTCIRETLLEYYNSYWQLIDRTTLINVILPQLVYGLKDPNNSICTLTLLALAAMVPTLGADIVVGGQRKQIFTDRFKREAVSTSKAVVAAVASAKSSPVSTPPPQKARKSLPVSTDKPKPVQLKPSPPPLPPPKPAVIPRESTPAPPPVVPAVQTNGHHPALEKPLAAPVPRSNGIADGHSDDDDDDIEREDDGQWSDWEQNPDPLESPGVFEPTAAVVPDPELVQPVSPPSPLKSLKLNNISKPKWNPNAPLGSEFEIPPLASTKKASVQDDRSASEDVDDFFKDMMPKVQTVQLMTQLETMFNLKSDAPAEQTKRAVTSSSFANKFGVVSHTHEVDDTAESAGGDNNWDE